MCVGEFRSAHNLAGTTGILRTVRAVTDEDLLGFSLDGELHALAQAASFMATHVDRFLFVFRWGFEVVAGKVLV